MVSPEQFAAAEAGLKRGTYAGDVKEGRAGLATQAKEAALLHVQRRAGLAGVWVGDDVGHSRLLLTGVALEKLTPSKGNEARSLPTPTAWRARRRAVSSGGEGR
jgi:hypothetical protein